MMRTDRRKGFRDLCGGFCFLHSGKICTFATMNWITFGKEKAPTLLLIPGLGVSYEIFLPLVRLLEERFRIVGVEVDGFTLGKQTRFTSVDDQAAQVIAYVQPTDCRWAERYCRVCWNGMRSPLTMPSLMQHHCCPCRAGWSGRCAIIRHSTCGPVTIGQSFGSGCSIPIILT